MPDENSAARVALAATRHNDATVAPAVSIIIPTYNTSQYIGEALDSVLAQTFTDYEIIVINDGSPDTSELERVLAPYRERITYLAQENRGLSGARNTGLRAARGRFIALLDSDDVWEPEYLAVHVAMLEGDPAVDVVFPNALIIGDSPHAGKKFMDVYPLQGGVTFARLITEQIYVWGGVTARRSAMLDGEMFDENLRGGEDLDLWLRILHRGGRIVYHTQVLAQYRRRDSSLSADRTQMLTNVLKILEKVKSTMRLSSSDYEAVEYRCGQIKAYFQLYEGRKAFFCGDTKTAITYLKEANLFFKSAKISAALLLLRAAPRLLLRVYDMRDQFIFKTSTKV